MDDSRIIELFYERSEQAVAELSDKYGALLKSVADHILNDSLDSEECVNDAFLAVWNAIPPERPDPLASYVCRIVRNLALKKYHKNTALKRNSRYDVALDELAECVPSSFSVEDEVAAKEVAGMIDGFLETLDRQSRILFIRRYWHADSMEELARLFHRNRHYLSVRLSRLRGALRRYLQKEGMLP